MASGGRTRGPRADPSPSRALPIAKGQVGSRGRWGQGAGGVKGQVEGQAGSGPCYRRPSGSLPLPPTVYVVSRERPGCRLAVARGQVGPTHAPFSWQDPGPRRGRGQYVGKGNMTGIVIGTTRRAGSNAAESPSLPALARTFPSARFAQVVARSWRTASAPSLTITSPSPSAAVEPLNRSLHMTGGDRQTLPTIFSYRI